jgi:hypothetical protein
LSGVPYELDDQMWTANTTVDAIAVTADKVYLGGAFHYVGPSSGCGAIVDTGSGLLVSGIAKVDDYVISAVSDGNGGWFIGGSFSKVGTADRNCIAHILSNHTLDMAWNPSANGSVMALALSGSKLYAGGFFSTIGGQTRNYIACIDANTGTVTTWNPNPKWSRFPGNCHVLSIFPNGPRVYVGGGFDTIGGQARRYIACLDTASGAATGWNPDANERVCALLLDGAHLYAGGFFTSIGGQAKGRIARVDALTGVVSSWHADASYGASPSECQINTIVAYEGKLYTGGLFDTISGQVRRNVACLDTGTGLATGWNAGVNGKVNCLSKSRGKIYAGGEFDSIGGQERSFIACLDTITGAATGWNPRGSDNAYSITESGAEVYVASSGCVMNGVKRHGAACIDRRTGTATAWNPSVDNAAVYSIVVFGERVILGGNFDAVNRTRRIRIACVDTVFGDLTTWYPEVNDGYSWISAMTVSKGKVYVGGVFNSIGGQARGSIACIDSSTGAVTGWYPHGSGNVNALAISGSRIFVGGNFDSLGGQLRRAVACLDTATGSATGWNANADGFVETLQAQGPYIYIGGSFTTMGGQSRNHLACLDTITGMATSLNMNLDAYGSIYAIASYYPNIYVSGPFLNIGGQPRSLNACFDANTGVVDSWAPVFNRPCNVMVADNSNLFIGGYFYGGIGGKTQFHFARLYETSTAINHSDPEKHTALDIIANIRFSGSRGSIRYSLPHAEQVRIRVYDMRGILVAKGTDGQMASGSHCEYFPTTKLSQGLYVLSFCAGSLEKRLTIILTR